MLPGEGLGRGLGFVACVAHYPHPLSEPSSTPTPDPDPDPDPHPDPDPDSHPHPHPDPTSPRRGHTASLPGVRMAASSTRTPPSVTRGMWWGRG